MPPLDKSTASQFIKLMYIGDSGAGKTGSLVSLVEAGYRLRILDMDNGVTVLRSYIMEQCPNRIDQVEYETCRDNIIATNMGPTIRGVAKAYVKATKLLTKWTDETTPCEWGSDTILVIDSLATLSQAAFNWQKSLNPGAVGKAQLKWVGGAQESIETILAMLTSETFECNVIVISHVEYIDDGQGNIIRGQVDAIGKKLGPRIPKYFNTMVLATMIGSGSNIKREIATVPTNLIALKNPAPFRLDNSLPLETGLATLFEKLKEI